MAKPITNLPGQRGLALIAVLWLSVLLALLSTAANRTSRADVTTAGNAQSAMIARLAVDSAIDTAVYLYATAPDGSWHADGTPHGWIIEGTEVRVSLSDERLRTDLNTASPDALMEMLGRVGVSEIDAEIFISEIIAHRDRARSNQPGQATEDQLRNAGHFAFGLVEDLRAVTGMPDGTIDRIARIATVYSGLPAPIAGSQRTGFGPLPEGEVVLTDRPQPLVEPRDPPESRSTLLRIHAEARTADGASAAREVVVDLAAQDPGQPYVRLMQRRSENRLFSPQR